MLRGDTRSIAISRVLLQMSTFGDERALSMSISTSVKTRDCRCFISASRSKTMSFTLLSDCDESKAVYVAAAARTAVGADDRLTRVHAAS